MNALTWFIIAPGLFMDSPLVGTISLYAMYANVLVAGLYGMYLSDALASYDDCTLAVTLAEYFCTSDDAAYADNQH